MGFKKLFALVDCNSFFCSCEIMFRPELKGRPVGVLSNNDGCFVARTPELKKLGIPMAAPYFKYKDLCHKHNVAIFSANFSLYTDISKRVMETLASFSKHIQVYSVDEAFLDLSGLQDYEIHEYAKTIKETVERNVGIPVRVGIGRTKTLAKVANHLAKSSPIANGVVILNNERVEEIALKRILVEDIWGIGKQSAKKLHELGVRTGHDFIRYSNEKMIQKRFTKVGVQKQKELMGEVCFELETDPEKKKEIMVSRSFGQGVFHQEDLKCAVAGFIGKASEKLRRQDSTCSSMVVFARTSLFKPGEQFQGYELVRFSGGTDNTLEMTTKGLSAVENFFKNGFEYKKAGVKLGGIVDKEETQLGLFEQYDVRSESLMQTMDDINHREGEGTLKSLACGVTDKSFAMNRKHKSPRYVTGWSELRKVK